MDAAPRFRGMVAGLAVVLTGWAAASADAATFTNACKNSATANNNQITVTMTANAPAIVNGGATVALTNTQQTLSVPGAISVAGYNLGFGTEGDNNVDSTVVTTIEGAN